MGALNISTLFATAQSSFQAKLAVPIATSAIADALSAQATYARDPLSAGAQQLRSDFTTERASLNADNQAATTSLLQLGTADATLRGLVDTLDELESLAAAAAGTNDAASRGNFNAAFQASLTSIVDSFSAVQDIAGGLSASAVRSNADGFVVAGLNLLGGGIADIVTQSINVVGGSREIPEDGLEFTFEVVQQGIGSNNATFTDFNRTGSRAVRGNVIRSFNASDQLNHAIELDISGSLGTVNFAFASGASDVEIRDAINAASGSTGVEAFIDTGGNIDLYSLEYGAGETVLISQILDGASNHVVAGYDQGQNARFLFTDLQTGDTADVEADGRSFNFSLSGLDFEIELYTEKNAFGASLLADNNNLTGGGAVRAFHVSKGGASAGSNNFVAVPELNVGSLGGQSGRLISQELVNNPQAALRTIQETRTQLASPLSRIAQATNEVNARITSNSNRLSVIDNRENDVTTLAGLIASFESVRQDAERQSSLALLSQISSIFPTAILPLLNAQQ